MQPEQTEESPIPIPNIDNPVEFDIWLNRYITHPALSFDDPNLKYEDGTPITIGERVSRTKAQVRAGVKDLSDIGRPKEDIIKFVMSSLAQPPKQNSNK